MPDVPVAEGAAASADEVLANLPRIAAAGA
jgi:hypothetical protein